MSPAVIRFLSTPSARRATERWVRQLCGEGFLSTPSARRATVSFPASCRDRKNFYPRPPRGGRPGKKQAELTSVLDFYPRPPRGGRRARPKGKDPYADFYPRPPRGGRPHYSRTAVGYRLFLSTPSARRATGCTGIVKPMLSISIHALREEGDRDGGRPV